MIVAYEEGGFAIYKVQPLLKMYEAPDWFSEMQCCGGDSGRQSSPSKTKSDSVRHRVVLVEM